RHNLKFKHRKTVLFFSYLLMTAISLLSATTSSIALAETRYVSDNLDITLRRGQGTGFQILRALKSGTVLEVLQTEAESGYSQVRTPGGTEGWVLTRFLMKEPSARAQLNAAKSRAANFEAKHNALSEQIALLSSEKTALENSRGTLDKSNNQLSNELKRIKATAGRALEMDGENKNLRSKVIKLERNNQALSQENETLKDRNARDWFMVGAGVAILSLLLGLLLSRFGGRRKTTSWSSSL
ncbi:TIGR04211 family SH3 domain-containing protein, partial [Gammaproteobacteria bacterium AH-315-C21]|nr:TIGR04211 family SH3 domain-containing protein [Gammaproteobacteria bacterium AH-315-C21]